MSIFPRTKSRMHSHREIRAWVALLFFSGAMVLVSNGAAQSQQSQRSTDTIPSRPVMPNMDPFNMPPVYSGDPMQNRQDQKRLQYLNAERQKSMVAETNRLVKLAADLNAQINSGERTQLTPDQVRQLAEIEKLAHRIRDRMSTSVRQNLGFDSGPLFLPPR